MRDAAGGGARGLGIAGFCATAVAFGPARNGYGLFLPSIREEFGLSTELLGVVASGLYAGYLGALVAVGLVAARVGPRLPVLIGLLCAAIGMALVALAPNAWVLAAGIVVAGTSAGWSWAPYNDAAERMVAPRGRDRTLSVVSTGTTFGILVCGPAALAAGESWRVAWSLFAAGALVALVPNALVLPGKPRAGSDDEGPARRPGLRSLLLRAEAAPLFVVALLFGAVTAFYFSFAVDLVVRSEALPRALAGPVFYSVLGVAGFVGLFTGDGVARFGLGRMLQASLAPLGVAVLLLGVLPSSGAAVGASAVLFGAGVMLMSALLAVWSSAAFPESPSTGFSAALFVFGIGLVAGPAALGLMAGAYGFRPAFLLAGVLALLAALVRPQPKSWPEGGARR